MTLIVLLYIVDYCEEIAQDEFWQFEFSGGTSSLESSLREPAHIFLQMVSTSIYLSLIDLEREGSAKYYQK
jgi:hypothetical protein